MNTVLDKTQTTDGEPTLADVLNRLEVRFASRADREALSRLAKRCGDPLPDGGLMIGTVGDRVIAAAPIRGGDVVAEPTPAGAAAAAVASYEVAHIPHRRPLSTGSPS